MGRNLSVDPTYAESYSAGALAALSAMAPALVGADVLPMPLHDRMEGLLNGHNYAEPAVDIAMHDMLGKHFGVSVSDLLGGALADWLPSYYAVTIGVPDEVARAAEKRAEGNPRLEQKVGGRTIMKIPNPFRWYGRRYSMRETRFGSTSRVDANCRRRRVTQFGFG
ncbi:hypothetical protein [Caballeronia sp. GACF5]|uniref:hypothetical protein n=1 Tax=Caballeronia sp. GACF5 TaxID=2921746 RepID=UPI0020282856|nr:hypothetical protein [Caballeronia sp. GACF5]